MHSGGSDQTGHFVGFVMRRLIFSLTPIHRKKLYKTHHYKARRFAEHEKGNTNYSCENFRFRFQSSPSAFLLKVLPQLKTEKYESPKADFFS